MVARSELRDTRTICHDGRFGLRRGLTTWWHPSLPLWGQWFEVASCGSPLLQRCHSGAFWDAAAETEQSIHTSSPSRGKTWRFKCNSTFPWWILPVECMHKMLSPWETPLKLSLYVIYTENKPRAKNHRECLFKHNSHGPWKMIKAEFLIVHVRFFRIS